MIRALLLALAASPAAAQDCSPSFPYQGGWLGGDGAYSVPLPDGRALWLFGDTIVGKPDQALRSAPGTGMVANTVAVSTCAKGVWDIRYAWRGMHGASPRAFFDSGTKKFKYWPMDGFAYKGAAYVLLSRIQDTPEGGAFGFEGVGVTLAKISPLTGDPSRWKVEYREVSSRKDAFPGASVVVQGRYLYLLSLWDDRKAKIYATVLNRIGLGELGRPTEGVEFLATNGSWRKGVVGPEARVLMPKGSSEMSVRFHADLKKWVALTGPSLMDSEVKVAFADRLEGPWSAPRKIHTVTETVPGTPGYDKDVFCYAGKEHAEFPAPPGKILFTYVCNTDFKKLFGDMGVYRPVVVVTDLGKP